MTNRKYFGIVLYSVDRSTEEPTNPVLCEGKMKKQHFTMAFWIFVAVTVAASVIYALYPWFRMGAVLATIILASILLFNRIRAPRWDLNDQQRVRESQLIRPAAATLAALVCIVMIGESGFESISGALTVWLLFALFCLAVFYVVKPKKLKKKD